jgi:hypothetical protein
VGDRKSTAIRASFADKAVMPHRGTEQVLRSASIVKGALVEYEVTGVPTRVYPRHGLDRRFVGAIMVGQDISGTGLAVTLTPDQVTADGYDPEIYCGVALSAAFTATIRLWVF